MFIPNDFGIEFISILYFGKYILRNSGFGGQLNFKFRELFTWCMRI